MWQKILDYFNSPIAPYTQESARAEAASVLMFLMASAVAFFGVVVALNILRYVVSTKSSEGEVGENLKSYNARIALHNATIDEVNRKHISDCIGDGDKCRGFGIGPDVDGYNRKKALGFISSFPRRK